MSSKRICGAFGIVAWFVGVSCPAFATPRVSVSALGDCPNQHQLEVALLARGLQLGSDYWVSIESGPSQVTLVLSRTDGTRLLNRQFSSDDCHAVAEAAAVVVEAYFIEVSGGKSEDALARRDTLGQRQAAPPIPDAAPEHEVAPEHARVQSPPTGARVSDDAANRPGPVVGLVNGPFPSRELFVVVPDTSIKSRRAIGYLQIGPVISMPADAFAAQIGAGLGIEWDRLPASADIGLATTLPSVSGDVPKRVQRWANQAVVRMGVPVGDRPRYRPWVGLGGMFAELRALDVHASPVKVSSTVLVGAGLELAWPLKDTWSGRLDFSCLALTSRDSYRVQPDGEIGRGPRVVCAAMVGIGIGSRGHAAKR